MKTFTSVDKSMAKLLYFKRRNVTIKNIFDSFMLYSRLQSEKGVCFKNARSKKGLQCICQSFLVKVFF